MPPLETPPCLVVIGYRRLQMVALILVLFLQVQTAHGEGKEEFEVRLKLVSSKVDEAEREITTLKHEYSRLNSERKALEANLSRSKVDEKNLFASLRTLSEKREGVVRQLSSSRETLREQEAKVRARLRALYVVSTVSTYGELFLRVGGDEIERLAVYSKSLRRHDDALFADLRKKVNAVTELEQDIARNAETQKATKAELIAKRGELETSLARTKQIAEEIATKKKLAERALNRLRQEADYLESLLEEFTATDSAQVEPEITPVSVATPSPVPLTTPSTGIPVSPIPTQPATRTISAVEPLPSAQEDSVELRGLATRGVSLVTPVRAKILQPFGKGKGSSFAELVSSKGVDCEAGVGARVEALAAGRVAFVGPMPGFGTVVVLDHGKRHYSLYGRLGESSVTKGMLIAARRAVGITGEMNEKGRNFYLEIRRDGAPVNPEGVVSGFVK